MGVTINVNGLTLVHKGSGGVAIATLPDVCKTPSPGGPVPIPYPNVARSTDLAKGTTTIKVDGGNMAANKGSEFSRSTGDEPGTVGGVKSGTNMKEATWLTYSFDVRLEGKHACRLTDKMFMNHANTMCMGGETQAPLPDVAKELIKNLEACEAGKRQLEQAKKANGGKPAKVVVGPVSSGFDGQANTTTGTVTINDKSPKCTQMETLYFELGNIARKSQFDAADAVVNTASREDYIRGQEKVEYDNVRDTIQATDKCKDAWGCKSHKFDFEGFRGAKNFDDYYKNYLSKAHKEHYGKFWDSVNGKP